MRERTNEKDPPEIILDDEEIRPIIQSLITVVTAKGFKQPDLERAIKREWKNLVPVSMQEYVFTDNELSFVAKVDNFFDEFGDTLVSIYDELCDYRRWKCGDNSNAIAKVKKCLYTFICAGYCNFCRNDSITQEYIRLYAVKQFGAKKNFWIGDIELRATLRLFQRICFPATPETRPYYTQDPRSLPSTTLLNCNGSYREFMNKYKFQNRDLTVSLLTAIWFIEKYY